MEIEEDFDALVYPNDAETDFSTISMSPEQNPAPIGNIWSDDEQSSSKIQNPKIMNLLKVIASLLVSPVVTVALSNLGQIYTWGSTPTYVARHGNCRTPGPVPLKSHIKQIEYSRNTIIVSSQDKIYTWGVQKNSDGDILTINAFPIELQLPDDLGVTDIRSAAWGSFYTLILSVDSLAFAYNDTTQPAQSVSGDGVTGMVSTHCDPLLLMNDGTLSTINWQPWEQHIYAASFNTVLRHVTCLTTGVNAVHVLTRTGIVMTWDGTQGGFDSSRSGVFHGQCVSQTDDTFAWEAYGHYNARMLKRRSKSPYWMYNCKKAKQ